MQRKESFLKSLYPWIIWVLAASFFYYKYLIQVSPGVMRQQLMSAYSLTGAGLGNLAACFFYGYLLMQIPVGILLDKWSPGKITSVAAAICATGIFLFANTHSFAAAGFARFCIGIGCSFAAVSCFKLISIWFAPRRFAYMAGLSMTVAMFGAVGGTGPLSLLVTGLGWRHALEWVSFPGFIISILLWLVIRDRKTILLNPKIIADHSVKLRDKLMAVLKNKQTWLLSLYSGLAFAPVSVFGGLWGTSFIEKAYQINTSHAANDIALVFIGFGLGCPLTGWLSDYIGRRLPLMKIGTFLAFVSVTFLLYLHHSPFYLTCFLVLFGIGASCFFLCFSMVKELYPIIFTATVLGFMNTFDSICEAITEPFVGKLLDLTWKGLYENGARSFSLQDYYFGLSVLPIYLGIAFVLLFFIEETYCVSKNVDREYLVKGGLPA